VTVQTGKPQTTAVRVLLIEDDAVFARFIEAALRCESGFVSDLVRAETLSSGLEHLVRDGADIVLLDLGLPDSNGQETFKRVHASAPDAPIIVLTGDRALAETVITAGAQDYLVKGQIDSRALTRCLQYAIEHDRALTELAERTQGEQQQAFAVQLLSLLNRSAEWTNTVRDLLMAVKKFTGVEAVGIRLREGDDFPYYESNGFPNDFIRSERFLCARDEAGEIIRDAEGNPCLECMCGNVIQGRTNPSLPFFTRNGSFWSNNTTKLQKETSEKERQARTRNRCNGEGYESVALIPLRSRNEVIGLLQLNDRRTDCFTPEMINFFENIGNSIGIAVDRRQAEEKIRSLAKFAAENPGPVLRIARDGTLLHANAAAVNQLADWQTQVGRFFGKNGAGAAADGASLTYQLLGDKWTTNDFIRALQQDMTTRILASPRILALNGREAFIQTVDEIPYQELTETAEGGQIGTTAFKEAGVKLRVTANVTGTGRIVLEVSAEQSAETDRVVGGIPVISTHRAETSLLVNSGESVIIGGLRRTANVKERSQVPLLGDIPYLGVLFRHTATRQETRDLRKSYISWKV